MKNLITLIFTLVMLTSCSSAQKNQYKLDGADLVADVAEKQILKSASGFTFPADKAEFCATNVSVEASYMSLKVRDAVDKALKAQREQEQNGFLALTSSSILRMACKAALSDLAPKLLNKEYDKYPCLIMVATSKTDDLICGSDRIK